MIVSVEMRDAAREIHLALKADGPGGHEITRAEARRILVALLRLVGAIVAKL